MGIHLYGLITCHSFVYNGNYLLTFCKTGSPCSQRKLPWVTASCSRPVCRSPPALIFLISNVFTRRVQQAAFFLRGFEPRTWNWRRQFLQTVRPWLQLSTSLKSAMKFHIKNKLLAPYFFFFFSHSALMKTGGGLWDTGSISCQRNVLNSNRVPASRWEAATRELWSEIREDDVCQVRSSSRGRAVAVLQPIVTAGWQCETPNHRVWCLLASELLLGWTHIEAAHHPTLLHRWWIKQRVCSYKTR